MSLELLKMVCRSGYEAPAATLALNALASFDSDFSAPWSSTGKIQVNSNGDVEEWALGTWLAQNSGTEWIDDAGATAADYECFLTKVSGTDPSSGDSLDTWYDCDTSRNWTWLNNIEATQSFAGTLTIREKIHHANAVSASVTITLTNGML